MEETEHLFLFNVAREADDLHAIEKGGWNCVQGIGGANKEHFRQIQWNIKVVIHKRAVLLWIEHFE